MGSRIKTAFRAFGLSYLALHTLPSHEERACGNPRIKLNTDLKRGGKNKPLTFTADNSRSQKSPLITFSSGTVKAAS